MADGREEEERHVVTVGLDDTRASQAAAWWAARQAERRGLTLRLLHAREERHRDGGDSRGRAEEATQEAAEALLGRTREQLSSRYPELSITTDLASGSAEKVLLSAAPTSRVFVIGTHGMRRLSSFFLGSTALAIVARSERPVILVRSSDVTEAQDVDEAGSGAQRWDLMPPEPESTQPDTQPQSPEPQSPEPGSAEPQSPEPGSAGAPTSAKGRVVVGIGLDHSYDNLLEFAFFTAHSSGLPLHVIHGMKLPPRAHAPGGRVIPHLAVEFRKQREQRVREMLRPWSERYPDVRLRGGLRLESPAGALIDEAAGSDLLVVGRCRKHRPALGPRIGPVAQAAVHHAGCPVAVVPHD